MSRYSHSEHKRHSLIVHVYRGQRWVKELCPLEYCSVIVNILLGKVQHYYQNVFYCLSILFDIVIYHCDFVYTYVCDASWCILWCLAGCNATISFISTNYLTMTCLCDCTPAHTPEFCLFVCFISSLAQCDTQSADSTIISSVLP